MTKTRTHLGDQDHRESVAGAVGLHVEAGRVVEEQEEDDRTQDGRGRLGCELRDGKHDGRVHLGRSLANERHPGHDERRLDDTEEDGCDRKSGQF